jgi:hypothetical protein
LCDDRWLKQPFLIEFCDDRWLKQQFLIELCDDRWLKQQLLIELCDDRWLKQQFLIELCDDRWLKQQFQEADVDKNGSLNYEECLKLLNQLNVKLPKANAKSMFDVSEGQACLCPKVKLLPIKDDRVTEGS